VGYQEDGSTIDIGGGMKREQNRIDKETKQSEKAHEEDLPACKESTTGSLSDKKDKR
jgi:hypothetical protein